MNFACTPGGFRTFPDAPALAEAAAAMFARAAQEAIAARGRFAVALAGGSTPRDTYRVLADRYGSSLDWSRVHAWWGDERCVPPAHDASNERMARSALLSRVPIPEANIHRVRTELGADAAADDYDRRLRAFAHPAPSTQHPAPFVLDLVLLGLGGDGHTLSLFPGTPALDERDRLAAAGRAPADAPPRDRVTLTYAALERSRARVFLVSGASKRAIVRRVLEESRRPVAGSLDAGAAVLPASRVRGAAWMLDADAAADMAGFVPPDAR